MKMKCDFCKEDIKDELLSRVKIDKGEKVMLCKSCELNLIKTNE
jgi:predicted SprT family Zn-dependent metalloprotease